jgi:hypothetical protein
MEHQEEEYAMLVNQRERSQNDHRVNQQSTTVASKPAMESVVTKGHAAASYSGNGGCGGRGHSRGMLGVYDQENHLKADVD